MVAMFKPQEPAALAALGGVEAAVDELGAASMWGLDADDLETLTVGLLRQTERLKALTATAVAEADAANLAARSGFKTLNAHLADLTGMPTVAIAPLNTLGRWLRPFLELARAFQAGVLSEAHIRELKKLDNPRTHLQLIRDQHLFIDSAPTLDFERWKKTLGYWLLNADPDGSLSATRAGAYGLSFKTLANGDVEIRGLVDPLTGEALRTGVEITAENLYRKEEAEHGGPQMTDRKRNVIALMVLVKKGFARKDGTFPKPLINIVMSQGVAEKLAAILADEDETGEFDFDLDPFDVDHRCETIRGTPLDPRRLLPMLLIGRLRRQVLGAKDRTLNLGHDVRFFNDVQMQAKLVEQRGQCATPGCDAPIAWLEADHVVPHSKFGPTDLCNCDAICRPDNHNKGNR